MSCDKQQRKEMMMIKYKYKMLKAIDGKGLAALVEKYTAEGWRRSGAPFYGLEGGSGYFFHLMTTVKSVKDE